MQRIIWLSGIHIASVSLTILSFWDLALHFTHSHFTSLNNVRPDPIVRHPKSRSPELLAYRQDPIFHSWPSDTEPSRFQPHHSDSTSYDLYFRP
jgi:hypothetical protein